MKIYLIRHGQTDWNLEGKIQGKTDISLNETGLKQARLLAGAMGGRPVENIFTSPLKRALETARAVDGVLDAGIVLLPELREVDFGVWEGLTWTEIKRTYPEDFKLWDLNPVEHAPTEGEKQADVKLRCEAAMRQILGQARGDIAVVSHGAMLVFVVDYLLSRQRERKKIIVKNASITTVEYDRDTGMAFLEDLNDDRHLRS